MSFDVAADVYDRFMGRFSEPLATAFADLVGVGTTYPVGARALDVGCGPGALTAVLAGKLGSTAVVALDPSTAFVSAARTRLPAVDVRVGTAEDLPLPDDSVDVALAQLVVHFMIDPVRGLAEMGRVTRPGGTVAASVWDLGGGRAPITPFWRAVRQLTPGTRDETERPGTRQGHLADLARLAGLRDVRETEITVRSRFATFEELWEPYTHGVGPVGDYVATLTAEGVVALRDQLAALLPEPPFELAATAWVVVARPPGGG